MAQATTIFWGLVRGDPVAGSLRDELLAIPGIEGADFDGDVVAPEGVRVRLSAGADPIRVGEEVRKILAGHGLRSKMTSTPAAAEGPPLPPARLEPPAGSPEPSAPVVTMPYFEEPLVVAPPRSEPAAVAPAVEIHPPEAVAPNAARVGLHGVAVEENLDGLTVVATRSDGVTARRPARNPGRGLDGAVVAAVAALTEDAAHPRLVEVFDAEAEGVAVVTVVVEVDDGSLQSGSAVVAGGRAFGVARATWRALSGQV